MHRIYAQILRKSGSEKKRTGCQCLLDHITHAVRGQEERQARELEEQQRSMDGIPAEVSAAERGWDTVVTKSLLMLLC